MTFKQKIPQFLPMMGQKVQVYTAESSNFAKIATNQVITRKTAKIQQLAGLTMFRNSKKNMTSQTTCTGTG
jgi:hypothetical protein